CESWKTLVSVTAYHSFAGEVEASNTPTIRRLTPSRRHQLSPIARPTVAPPMSDRANTTMPISRQVAALIERIVVLMPKLLSCCSPAKANLLDPRLGQRRRAYGCSVDRHESDRNPAVQRRSVGRWLRYLKIRSARHRQEPIRLRAFRVCGAVRYRSTTGQAFRATSGA